MDQDRTIQGLKSIPVYASAMEKLTTNPNNLTNDEKTFLLSVALLLLRKYQADTRLTSFIELAYYIILRYSLYCKDYLPLYDFAVNIGFYPIAQALTEENKIQFDSIGSALVYQRIEEEFRNNSIIETFEQKQSRTLFINGVFEDFCYIAPTSFGKSSLILDRIQEKWNTHNKVAIIVPTKSLLMQTYRAVRKRGQLSRVIVHDEMYTGQERFIAVLTQERALRLLDKYNISFDSLYIDEAHRMLERDSRAFLLARLIKINRERNNTSEIIYLSPLISSAENLCVYSNQNILEKRIRFNMKEPECYEFSEDKIEYSYNRFTDTFYEVGLSEDLYVYIRKYSLNKNFCYLYTPKKIEHFSLELSRRLQDETSSTIDEMVALLSKYVHKDFLAIKLLKKGIVYLHGKMPDTIKDYLEYKFSTVPELRYLVANRVVLEGINLPIDSLFILSGSGIQEKDLVNLIGRVNRLDYIFSKPSHLEKLMPPIHFVNSSIYNRKKGNLETKMKFLKKSMFADKVRNPILQSFDFEKAKQSGDDIAKCEMIIQENNIFFMQPKTDIDRLRQRMVALGISSMYSLDESTVKIILERIQKLQKSEKKEQMHFLDRLQWIFISGLDSKITDKEFLRLSYDRAIAYYKRYYKDRKRPLNECILSELAYFHRRIDSGDSRMYIGEGYGEIPYASIGADAHKNVYIDLSQKSNSELVNIAIIKQKIEEDFTGFKLRMIFQLMFEYEIITETEYFEIMYGTTDSKKIELMKMGLSISIINRLQEDGQLDNISFDAFGNVCTEPQYAAYRDSADDFYKFELDRYL